ncbi:MAG: 3,4-dehydroadipyl-CoA semialdehyde dehydrogenase [Myxococcales bacterium]|nr:3,4-dehydroadipyl-CoA semialdehyde dehydrogenase [Myxococcales bacterium]
MRTLPSYLVGTWQQPQTGEGDRRAELLNPATEAPLAVVGAARELDRAVAHGRDVGGPALRAMTIAARGEMLQKLAKKLHEHREELIEIAIASGGNTRGDAKFDIDGATGVLAAYARLARELGDDPWIVEDEAAPIMRTSKIRVQHVLLPLRGVAVHINAFNFPAWGMVGKAAVAWLAGVPVLSKPATSTSLLAHRIAELIVASGLVPEGAFQLLMGSAGDLLDHLGAQDVVAFTGSAGVGALIRGHAKLVAHNTRVNIEADSLNAVVVGPDVEEGSELFDLVVRDCVIEMTQKAGQKCTATRRILVPQERLEELRSALVERLDEVAGRTGDPASKGVRMGPLATAQQLADAREGVARLLADDGVSIVRGDPARAEFTDVPAGKGYFFEPILLEATPERAADPGASVHALEVFGPVSTLLPYDGSVEQAAALVAHGGGSLVTTVYSDSRKFTAGAVAALGPFLGRLVLADEKHAGGSMAPGCVFPQGNHGGPGRAGGGAELGGLGGLRLYLQRTAIQGGAGQLARVFGKKK